MTRPLGFVVQRAGLKPAPTAELRSVERYTMTDTINSASTTNAAATLTATATVVP